MKNSPFDLDPETGLIYLRLNKRSKWSGPVLTTSTMNINTSSLLGFVAGYSILKDYD